MRGQRSRVVEYFSCVCLGIPFVADKVLAMRNRPSFFTMQHGGFMPLPEWILWAVFAVALSVGALLVYGGWMLFKCAVNNVVQLDEPGIHVPAIDVSRCPAMQSMKSSYLTNCAKQQAEYQAAHQTQGHQNWDVRKAEMLRVLEGYNCEEICAESWSWQKDLSDEELWQEAVDCWRQSSGHWEVASKRHDLVGFAKRMGHNGIWYFTLIAADRRT